MSSADRQCSARYNPLNRYSGFRWGISPTVEATPVPEPLGEPDDPIKLREGQKDALKKLEPLTHARRFHIGWIVAFCGAGKSISLIMIAFLRMLASGFRQRVLIVVPKRIIAEGFLWGFLPYGRSKKSSYEWFIPPAANLCDAPEGSVRETVKAFLLTPTPDSVRKQMERDRCISSGVLITTTPGIVAAWDAMTTEERSLAARNLTLVADEVHHNYHDSDAVGEHNKLGRVLHDIHRIGHASSSILGGTGTPYRSNGESCIPQELSEDEQHFIRYDLPWDVHRKDLKHLRELGCNWAAYEGDDPLPEVLELCKKNRDHVISVIFPGERQAWRLRGDMPQHRTICDLKKIGYRRDEICDLVTQEGENAALVQREEARLKEERLRLAKGLTPKIRVFLSVAKLDEGTDVRSISRTYNLAPSQSVGREVQRFGRMLRDFKGKRDVEMVTFFPALKLRESDGDEKRAEELRAQLSARFNTLMIYLTMRDMFGPPASFTSLIPTSTGADKEEEPEQTLAPAKPRTKLSDIVGDKDVFIRQEVFRKVEPLETKGDSGKIVPFIEAALKAAKIPRSKWKAATAILLGEVIEAARFANGTTPSTDFVDIPDWGELLRTEGEFDRVMYVEGLERTSLLVGRLDDETYKELKRATARLDMNRVDAEATVRLYRYDSHSRTKDIQHKARRIKRLVKAGRGIGKTLSEKRTLFGRGVEGKAKQKSN